MLCSANGLIRVSASGLDGNYQYRLNDGDPQDSPEFGGLTAGVYSVTAIGQYGFTAAIGPVALTQPDSLAVEATVDGSDMTAVSTGGMPPYRYSIDGAGFQDEPLFADLPNGVYTLTVRDSLGCLSTANFSIANTDTLLIESIQIAHPLCADGDQGSIFIQVLGGVPPYMYSIDGGAPTSDPAIGGLGAGIYEVVITDAQGLSVASGPIALIAPDPIVASVNVLLNTAIVAANGGTGALTYSLDGADYQALNVFGGLGNGDYTVFVRDENGCIALANFSIDIPPLAATVAVLKPILCSGDLGVFQVVAVGGALPYSYRLNGGAWQSNPIFAGVPAGILTFEARDALGDTAVVELTVANPTPVDVSVSVSANNASVSIFGGLPPYVLISLNGLPVNADDLIGMAPGNYVVVVSDVNGCTASTTFAVVANPLSAQTLVQPIVCHNDANGSITVCVSGSDNATIAGTVPMTPVSIPGCALGFESGELDAGDYAFTITDQATGYSLTLAPLTLLNPEPLQLTAAASNNQIDALASGGVPPYAYSIDGVIFQDLGVFADLAPGIYTVTAMDANGCEVIVADLAISVSTRNPVAEWGLRLWPNPAQTHFFVEFDRSIETTRAELCDALGRSVHRYVFGRGASGGYRQIIEVGDLPEGVYLLRIWDEKGAASVRVVLAR